MRREDIELWFNSLLLSGSALICAMIRAYFLTISEKEATFASAFFEYLKLDSIVWILVFLVSLAILRFPVAFLTGSRCTASRIFVTITALLVLLYYYLDGLTYRFMGIHFDYRILWHADEIPDIQGMIIEKLTFDPALLILLSGTAILLSLGFWLKRKTHRLMSDNRKIDTARVMPYLFSIIFCLLFLADGSKGQGTADPLKKNVITIQRESLKARYLLYPDCLECDLDSFRQLLGKREWTDHTYPLLHRTPPAGSFRYDSEFTGHNLVVIMLESFRAADVGVLGGKHNITPFFDELARKGILFENFYANGIQTARALLAVEASLPPYYGERYMTKKPFPNLLSLGKLLTGSGYVYSHHTGNDGRYDRVDEFYGAQGMTVIRERNNIPHTPEERFKWGIHDEFVYRDAIEQLSSFPQPFAAKILSLSNHQPYSFGTYPPEAKGLEAEFRAAMRYSDQALREFFEAAREHDFFENTLFVILADTGENFRDDASILRTRLSETVMRIPLLIYSGDGRLAPERNNTLGSATDILPTVSRMLGMYPDPVPWWGESLFSENQDRTVYANNPWEGGHIMLRKDDYKLMYHVADEQWEYNRIDGFNEFEAPIPPDLLPKTEQIMRLHDLAQYVLREQRIYPEK